MRRLFVVLIGLYQYVISPLFPQSCRFSPSCSEYSKEAITKYGALKGLMMSVRRIMKCHPFHPGGYDPVR